MAYNDILEPAKLDKKGFKKLNEMLEKKIAKPAVAKPSINGSNQKAQPKPTSGNPFDDFLSRLE